jgi:hypothetical protein
MSNTIAAPVTTSVDYAAYGAELAAILDNSKDMWKLCKVSYQAVKSGAQQKELAAATNSALKTRRNSTVKSISEGTMSNRVSAYRFIAENELPDTADTVGETYTLISKKTGKAELPTVLLAFRALPTSKQTGPALAGIIIEANERAKKTSATPKTVQSTEPTDEGDKSTPVKTSAMTADDVIALLEGLTAIQWNNTDRRRIATVAKQVGAKLSA